MKSLKKAINEMADGAADYQAEMQGIFAIAEWKNEARAYQLELAELEASQASIKSAALNRRGPDEMPLKKIRIRFKSANGRSKNGFLRGAATGQIDMALEAFRAANGRWPNEAECSAIDSLIAIFSDGPWKKGRSYEHMAYWQGNGDSKQGPIFKGKGPFYIG